MIATKENLRDSILDQTAKGIFMYCSLCGEQYSAHRGDYWDHPADHVFTCCDQQMVLAREIVLIKEVV